MGICVPIFTKELWDTMRKWLAALLLFLLVPCAAMTEGLDFTVYPESVRPGKIERISFSAPSDGEARLELLLPTGEGFAVIRENVSVSAGVNHLTWDGEDLAGLDIPAGEYLLALTLNGESVSQPLTVGEPSPQILSLSAGQTLVSGETWPIAIQVNEPGTLTISLKAADSDEWIDVLSRQVPKGESAGSWDGMIDGSPVSPGEYAAQFSLTDETGYTGTARRVSLTVSLGAPAPAHTAEPAPEPEAMIPSAHAPAEGEYNYWTLPIGDFDEAAIWEIMMQPMTVISEKGKGQKDVYRLRRTPDSTISKENVVGEITYESQGLHILETRDDGWTLVEAYNSSYGPDCASRRGYGVTDDLIQGYVKTSLLKTVIPRTDYGLLIDKCEQRMYIFDGGKCTGSLLVSTGLNNAKQSWNETPAGEFIMISRMGGFPAGNLWCAYGMRINGGCAIHEVPYIGNADTPAERRDYSSTVKLLGQKASHGCIRVQKAANDQGQNIKWLWDNIKVNTKVLIWDDTGRRRPYPAADDYELYYNPNGGQYYHEDQYCASVKSRFLPLTAFAYGELDTGSFAKLKPCPKCATIMRKSQIDAMNALSN